MKNVITRSISGILYIVIIVGAIFGGGWWFFALTFIFCAIGTFEYQRLCEERAGHFLSPTIRAFDLIGAMLVWAITPSSYFAETLSSSEPNTTFFSFMFIPLTILLLLFAYVIIRFAMAVFDESDNPWGNLGNSILGLIYVAVPMLLLNTMCIAGYTKWEILMMFILIWVNDTGAFCVGSLMGHHKLCQRLSPKKSWEGYWGGMTFCIIGGTVYALVTGNSVAEWIFIGILISIMATIGDLFESMLKRSAGVKDSGRLIPGHGGILDRIDSLLFVAPTFLLVLMILSI